MTYPSIPSPSKGNRTKGITRRGYRGGRKPIYPPEALCKPVMLKMSQEAVSVARYLGLGSLSAGVKAAMEMLMPHMPRDLPVDAEHAVRGYIYTKFESVGPDVAAIAARVRAAAPYAEWDDMTPPHSYSAEEMRPLTPAEDEDELDHIAWLREMYRQHPDQEDDMAYGATLKQWETRRAARIAGLAAAAAAKNRRPQPISLIPDDASMPDLEIDSDFPTESDAADLEREAQHAEHRHMPTMPTMPTVSAYAEENDDEG